MAKNTLGTNQNNTPPQVRGIPVYGSAKEIVSALHKMTVQKAQNAMPKKVLFLPLPKPPVKTTWFLMFLLLCTVIIVATFFFLSPQAVNPFGPEKLKIDSPKDQKSIQNISQATGITWESIKSNQTGSKEEKLASLLMLHEEESATFALLTSKNAILNKTDLENLKLNVLDTQPSRENTAKLTENLLKIHRAQNEKQKSQESEVHINRLKLLNNYFSNYEPSENDVVPPSADKITLDSHPAQNQKELQILLIKRFNIFIESFVKNS